MANITPLSLYIINKVKLRRLILALSARYLSLLLKHSEGYVARIEDGKYDNQYPASELPNLAKELKLEIHELLPPDENRQATVRKLKRKF